MKNGLEGPPALPSLAPPPLPAVAPLALASVAPQPASAAHQRASRGERVRAGARATVSAARLVATDGRLRSAALLPTALNAVGCALCAALAALAHEGDESAFHAFLVTFVALSSMPPTLLFRMWARVGVEARRALGASPGEPDPFPGRSWAAVAWTESGKALRQVILVSVGLAPAFLVIEILPFVGHSVTVALGVLWAGYWIVVDALEIPFDVLPGPRDDIAQVTWFERHLAAIAARSRLLFAFSWTARLAGRLARPWRHEVAFTDRRPWECAGFGAAAGLVLATPVVGLFFRAVAIVAATALLVDEDHAG